MKLPQMAGADVESVLARIGYALDRQKGSHRVWVRAGHPPIVVPAHDPLKRGTLRSIIRATGLSVDEFLSHR